MAGPFLPVRSDVDRLFVYGIFLSQYSREQYEMTNPEYDCVSGYATMDINPEKPWGVVEAIPAKGLSLTGLTVSIPEHQFKALDRLEAGYDRIQVITVSGNVAWMYVAKGVQGESE